jgi:hypothetical protein
MIRHLTPLVLCGVLGSMVLVGNAEACHRKKCGHAPVACAAPAPVCTTTCAPKVKHCGFSFKLPTLCHKKAGPVVACATPVYCAPTPVYYSAPMSYPAPSPQTSAQH